MTRDLTKLEEEIIRVMSNDHKMVSTSFHVFVAQKRTNRLLLSRLRKIGMIEVENNRDAVGTQHWVLSEKGRAWARENP